MKIDASRRVLVTASSGSLGWTVSTLLAPRCNVIAAYLSHPCVPEGTAGVKIDLTDSGSVERLFSRERPDITIHLAAITDPDRCEREPDLAFNTNFQATLDIAHLADDMGTKMVFVSTDLVFDGLKGNYTEDDLPHPLSIYGMTKLRAEESVLEQCENGLILRSSLIYGRGSPLSKTFLDRVLDNLSRGEKMRFLTDQKRNPVSVEDLARAIVTGIEMDLSGLYHIGGPEILTRYEFGQKVCEVFGYDQGLLEPIRMQDFSYVAKRPLDSTLNIERFTASTGFVPSGLLDGLIRIRNGR